MKTLTSFLIVCLGIVLYALLTLGGSATAQNQDLQELIDSTVEGGTLQVSGSYTCNCVLNRAITISGQATVLTPNADPALDIRASNVTIDGLEVTSTHTNQVHDLVRVGSNTATSVEQQPDNVVLTNMRVHGHPTQEVQRGVSANSRALTISNSRIYEIHGRGYDTQAICGWNGPGPFTIINNYLEAAGENVMFGGALAAIPNLIPSDIVIKNNHFFKPLSWKPDDPSYAGLHWSVKNLFELKNARRVLIEGNVFENNWTDAQAGRAIVFTPRPSDSGLSAVIEDVLFVNNLIKNVGSGVLLLRHDEPPAPTDTRLRRVRIANNLFEKIDGPRFGSNGVFVTVIARTEDVTIEHNTAIQTGNIISTDYDPNLSFVYRDNITRHNEYGIFGSGLSTGNPTIDHYFPGSIITANLFAKEVNAPWNADLIYPSGNYFPESLNAIGFVDLASGNYRLAPSSQYKGTGSDGTDPGCNIDVLTAALNGSPSPTPTPTPTPLPSPTPTPAPCPTPEPKPSPSPTPQPCELTRWPSSIAGQNARMAERRAQGCYPVKRASGVMVYARP